MPQRTHYRVGSFSFRRNPENRNDWQVLDGRDYNAPVLEEFNQGKLARRRCEELDGRMADGLPQAAEHDRRSPIPNSGRLLRPGDRAWQICCEVMTQLAVLAQDDPQQRQYAVRKIRWELWRPTCDEVLDGVVRFDRAKYNPALQAATREARVLLQRSSDTSEIRHEHAVPRAVLSTMIVELSEPTPMHVSQLLERFAKAALVTKEEDGTLREKGLNSAMPVDWDRNDPWARYRAVGLDLSLPAGAGEFSK